MRRSDLEYCFCYRPPMKGRREREPEETRDLCKYVLTRPDEALGGGQAERDERD